MQTNVFGPACRCHWGLDREANLELYAPGLEARLIGRPSTQCDNMTLIVPGDPDGSYLVRKLMDAAPRAEIKCPAARYRMTSCKPCARGWRLSIGLRRLDNSTELDLCTGGRIAFCHQQELATTKVMDDGP